MPHMKNFDGSTRVAFSTWIGRRRSWTPVQSCNDFDCEGGFTNRLCKPVSQGMPGDGGCDVLNDSTRTVENDDVIGGHEVLSLG